MIVPSVFLGEKVASYIWHMRLGHPNQRVLSLLNKNKCLSISGSTIVTGVCASCMADKYHRLPFTLSNNVTNEPGTLIHSDLWGLYPEQSNSGFCYFLLFVDDCIKFSWIYFLHHKSEVDKSFHNFKSMIEKQFSTTIKVLQSDGGGEYICTPLRTFLRTQGILHQFSCPHTPQQNGTAQRKIRHVVEMGISLLDHNKLPKLY